MKVAVIGSRGLLVNDLEKYLPKHDKYDKAAPLKNDFPPFGRKS